MTGGVDEVLLLLEWPSQVLDIFLFLLKVDVHLLGLGPEASILIASNVILDLQVAIHVTNFLSFSGPEEGCLIGFGDIYLLKSIDGSAVIGPPPRTHYRLLNVWHVSSAAKENVTRAIVVNDLLVYTTAFLRRTKVATSFQ